MAKRKFTKYPSNYVKASALNHKVIYDDGKIKVETTGRSYDFIATIENLTNYEYCLDEELHSELEQYLGFTPEGYCIAPHDWVGILANDEGYMLLDFFKNI